MDKVPKIGHVFNPKTGRQIKIGGQVYRDLIAKKIINPPEEVRIRDIVVQPPKKAIKEGFVINPNSGRAIKKGAALYKQLLKQGVIFYDDDLPVIPQLVIEDIKEKSKSPKEKKGKYSHDDCMKWKQNKLINPITGRKIQEGKGVYNDLKKHCADVKSLEKQKEEKKKSDRTKCVNKETFLLFDDVDDIPEEDFIMLPSGYCFAISELVDWLKTTDFSNKNPHLTTEELFNDSNKKVWEKHPELANLISKFFKKKKEERNSNSDVIKDHLDVLYKIGDVGRICYYDNIQSFEQRDSGQFEYSINSIADLSHMIESLPTAVKNVFKNLHSGTPSINVEKIINDANSGAQCIHGIGKSFIYIFIINFLILEKSLNSGSNIRIRYEPLRCKLYFVRDKNNTLVFYNAENRLILNTTLPDGYYHRTHFKNMMDEITKNDTTIIWEMNTVRQKGLSEVYKDTCKNDDTYQVTVEAVDEWSELEEWRKIKLDDGYCFDLMFLLITITNQLNTTRSTNPSPVYPYNPFTNVNLTMNDLINLKRRINNNYINVAPCITKFLYNPELCWSEDTNYTKSIDWMNRIIGLFDHEMRFKRYIQEIDTDNTPLINGYWVLKTERQNQEENLIYGYLQTMRDQYIVQLRAMPRFKIPTNYYYSLSNVPSVLIHGYNDINEF
jgi:hypothetical protein